MTSEVVKVTLEEFAHAIERDGNEVLPEIGKNFRDNYAHEAHRLLVKHSAYLTGRYTAHHQAGADEGDFKELPIVPSYTIPGAETVDAALVGVGVGEGFILGSPLPYAPKLEKGHSKQTPDGNYRQVQARVGGKVDELFAAAVTKARGG